MRHFSFRHNWPATFAFFLISLVFFNSSYHRIQDISILFNLIIILLMLFNTFVFQVGLVALLLERFRAMLIFSCLYLTFSIVLHSWLMVRGPASIALPRSEVGVDLCLNTNTRRNQRQNVLFFPWGKYLEQWETSCKRKKNPNKYGLLSFVCLLENVFPVSMQKSK